jgi:phage shock protein C
VNPRRLYRCRHDRQLAGVASGMAEYLDIDPTVVRILWILSAFLGGFTILLYIILAFVVPLEPATGAAPAWARAAGPAWGAPADPAGGSAAAGYGSDSDAPGDAGAGAGDPARATVDGGEPGTAWTNAGDPASAWTAPSQTWTTPDPRPDDRRGGGAGIIFGVLLIVFGGIAMANILIPGWAIGGLLWPAFVVALGAALLVGAVRRPVGER